MMMFLLLILLLLLLSSLILLFIFFFYSVVVVIHYYIIIDDDYHDHASADCSIRKRRSLDPTSNERNLFIQVPAQSLFRQRSACHLSIMI